MNKDLTVGRPESVLWRFCLPLFGSVIFQQLYNIADSFVAGQFIGENALAAVGNSYEITLIFIAFAFGCNIGCSVIVSQLFGAKKYIEMKTAVWTTLIASVVLVAVLMLVGFLLGERLLALIDTPDELMRDSLTYLNIYILGVPFLFFYKFMISHLGFLQSKSEVEVPFRLEVIDNRECTGRKGCFPNKKTKPIPENPFRFPKFCSNTKATSLCWR